VPRRDSSRRRQGAFLAAERFFRDLVGGPDDGPSDWSSVSPNEIAAADLFFAELMGRPARPRLRPRRRVAPPPLAPSSPPATVEGSEAVEPEAVEPTRRRVGTVATIRWLQDALNRIASASLAVDGLLGPKTRGALQRFQQQQGLPTNGRMLASTLHRIAARTQALPPGVRTGAVPTHDGRAPDLSAGCDEPVMLEGFAFGSATPSAEHRVAIAALAQAIVASQSSSGPVHLVCLCGHTDNVGAPGSNDALGQRRAEAVQDELAAAMERIAAGASARVGLWSTTAGETEPVAPNDSDAGRARNRRVEIRRGRRWLNPKGATTITVWAESGSPPAETEAAEQSASPPFQVPLGGTLRLFAKGSPLPMGNPAFVWATANPSIATVKQVGTSQDHPNTGEVRGIAPGAATISLTYTPATGASATTPIAVVVAAPAAERKGDSIEVRVHGEVVTANSSADGPFTDAIVTIITRAEADTKTWPLVDITVYYVHESKGSYLPQASLKLDPGEYLLVVRKAGMSPVVQRLTLATKNGALEVLPGWGKTHGDAQRAATVGITNLGPRADPLDDSPRFATIDVSMMRRTEWVGLASHNHFSRRPPPDTDHTRYLPFAEGRRNQLFKARTIDKGTICTLLDCQGRRTLVTVKAAKAGHREWVVIHEREKSSLAADKGKKRPSATSNDEIGIEDFYDAIDTIGWLSPDTLVEAGVFGHGWVQGPIVWGTSDFEPSLDRWAGRGSSPKDLDGRQKDFFRSGGRIYSGPQPRGGAMQSRIGVRDAFRKHGKLYLWGCVHMTNVIAQYTAAWAQLGKNTPRDEFFSIAFPDGGRELATLDDVKRNVAQWIVSSLYGRALEHGDCRGNVSYAGAAAQYLGSGATVFAAAPGMGSSYTIRDNDNVFFIDTNGENSIPFKWWKREFAGHFETDADGFVNYQKLKDAPLPNPGWRPRRHAILRDEDTSFDHAGSQHSDFFVLRLPSGFELLLAKRSTNNKTFAAPVAHTIGKTSGQLYIVRGATLQIVVQRPLGRCALLQPDANLDSALFVDTGGNTSLLEAPTGSKAGVFAVRTAAIPVHPATHKWRNDWTVGAKASDITDGGLESVTARWYW